MSTPSSHVNLSGKYYGCRLGRTQLDRIVDIASDGLPPDALKFSTRRGTYHFEADTLTDLVAAVQASPDSGATDQWTNLAIETADPQAPQRVAVLIDTDRTEVQLISSNSTWAHGQQARLERFLKEQAGAHDERRSPTEKKLRGALWGAMLWLGILLYAIFEAPDYQEEVTIAGGKKVLTEPTGQVPTLSLVFLLFLFLWCVAGAFRQFVRLRASRPALVVTADLPTGNTWQRLSMAEKLAALGLAVAVLAMTGTLASAAADVFKP
jgi:hypothetical protein